MRDTAMRIKSRGYDVVIDMDYDTGGEYVSELLADCDGGFTEAGFSVPERIKDGEIARADGYQIMEGYYGGNFSYDKIKKGDELRSKDRRSYELVSYGEYDDDAMDEILERISLVWDTEYYSVRVVGLEGEILDMLCGVTLDKMSGTKLDIIEEIIEYGVEIPEEMLEGLRKTEEK